MQWVIVSTRPKGITRNDQSLSCARCHRESPPCKKDMHCASSRSSTCLQQHSCCGAGSIFRAICDQMKTHATTALATQVACRTNSLNRQRHLCFPKPPLVYSSEEWQHVPAPFVSPHAHVFTRQRSPFGRKTTAVVLLPGTNGM